MDTAVSRGGPFVHFVIKNLLCLTSILWCLVLAASSQVFSDWPGFSIAVTGALNLLPYFIAGSLVIWPWTSWVVSGVMFTTKGGENDGWYAS